MAVSLSKGQKVDLTKGNPGLSKLMIGLGWDTNRYDGGADFDLDAAAFLVGGNGKVASDGDFVFYGNLKHASGGVVHTGDNLTGEGDGDEAEDQPQEGDSSGDNNEDQQPGSSAGGKYEEGNYIKDGNTYYKEDWDKYYEEMLKRLAEDGNLTDEMRQIIEDYFKIIE